MHSKRSDIVFSIAGIILATLITGLVIFYVVQINIISHRVNILWADHEFDQFDRKAHIVSGIDADVMLHDLCLKESKAMQKNAKTPEDKIDSNLRATECIKYSYELDGNLYSAILYFKLNQETLQKIETVLNRKDKEIIDSESKILSQQVYETLYQAVMQQKKRLGFSDL